MVAKVKSQAVDDALKAAKDRSASFDAAIAQSSPAIGRIESLLSQQATLLQETRASLVAKGISPGTAVWPTGSFSRPACVTPRHVTTWKPS